MRKDDHRLREGIGRVNFRKWRGWSSPHNPKRDGIIMSMKRRTHTAYTPAGNNKIKVTEPASKTVSKTSPPMSRVGKPATVAARTRAKQAKRGSMTEPHTSSGKKKTAPKY
jgi:hypothetical protein